MGEKRIIAENDQSSLMTRNRYSASEIDKIEPTVKSVVPIISSNDSPILVAEEISDLLCSCRKHNYD